MAAGCVGDISREGERMMELHGNVRRPTMLSWDGINDAEVAFVNDALSRLVVRVNNGPNFVADQIIEEMGGVFAGQEWPG